MNKCTHLNLFNNIGTPYFINLKKVEKMGNSPLNTDPHARIFITLKKPIHYAGEMVRGQVHLICTEDRPQYRCICLVIDGREETQSWEQDSWIPHIGKRDTYHGELTLVELKKGMRVGHYSYQFAFLLPGNMPASYFDNSTSLLSCQKQSIHYYLSGSLLAGQDTKDVQTYKMKLHIREPPRGIQAPIIVQRQSESKCWSCCCSCGTSVLTLQLDGNHIRVNVPFKVRGKIDTSASKTQISGYKIRIIQKYTIMAGEQSFQKYKFDRLLVEKRSSGDSFEFEEQLCVQELQTGYTFIGNISSRTYYLVLQAVAGCCYSNPKVEMHVVLLNDAITQTMKSDMKSEEDELRNSCPADWKPQVFQEQVLAHLPIYRYMPHRAIYPTNQAGKLLQIDKEMMSSDRMTMTM